MKYGILYGVSVGPGDPELMTVKAVRILERCPVVAAPRTAGEKTLALDIASGAADLTGKTILNLEFAMTRDPAELAASHRAAADTLENELREGRDVAMLNLGDVSVYSTFAYMMELLRADGFESVMIPGVPSFCAVAAALGTGLTEMNEPLHILPAGGMAVDEALRLPGTKVLMKTGRAMPAVRAAIRRAGLADRTQLVQNCGLPDEKICRRLEEASDEISYFTTMIVKP
jgi:precorrin-2/cobalt-factor-2 C20-methyltransferase